MLPGRDVLHSSLAILSSAGLAPPHSRRQQEGPQAVGKPTAALRLQGVTSADALLVVHSVQ